MCDVHKTERAVHGPFSARLWSVQYPFESRLTSVLLKRSGVKRTVHGKFFWPYTVVPFHFHFPVPVLSAQARCSVLTRILYYIRICTIRLHTWQNVGRFYYRVFLCVCCGLPLPACLVIEPVAFTRSKNLATPRLLTNIPSLSNILAIVGGW